MFNKKLTTELKLITVQFYSCFPFTFMLQKIISAKGISVKQIAKIFLEVRRAKGSCEKAGPLAEAVYRNCVNRPEYKGPGIELG